MQYLEPPGPTTGIEYTDNFIYFVALQEFGIKLLSIDRFSLGQKWYENLNSYNIRM